MKKTTTIHIEPLDEGFVVKQDGKRKASTYDELKQGAIGDLMEMLEVIRRERPESIITITLETEIPREV